MTIVPFWVNVSLLYSANCIFVFLNNLQTIIGRDITNDLLIYIQVLKHRYPLKALHY